MPDPTVLFPNALEGTLGYGVYQGVNLDSLEFEGVPYRPTPPYGEQPMYNDVDVLPYPIDPPVDQALVDDMLHEQMHGAPARDTYVIQRWVNPSNPGIPNLGPISDTPWESGHSQITVLNPSLEQGWGMDPAIVNPRYPISEGVNPYYASGTHRRNGQLPWTSAGVPLQLTTQGAQTITNLTRNRSTVHQQLVDNPGYVPYSATITPAGGGGAGPVAMNMIPHEDEGIYA